MATHLSEHGTRTFEGEDLPALLAEVMEVMGEEATIVSARKVRSGGVAGFFARERYQVIARPAPTVAPAPAPSVPAPSRPPVPVAPAAAVPVPASPTGHLDALLALADAVSERERPSEPSFGDLLARAATAPDVIDLADRAVPAERRGPALRPRTGPVVARRPAAPRPAAARTPEPVAPDPAPEPPRGEIVVAHTRSGRRLARLRPAFAEAPRLTRAEAAAANVAVAEAAAVDVAVSERARPSAPGPEVTEAAAPPAPPTPPGPLTVLPLPAPAGPDPVEDTELPWTPVPALDTRGVLAVVGDASALAAARRIAADGGLDAAEVIVAAAERPGDVRAWNWVRSPAEAARRRALWAARPATVVVAVVASPTPSGVGFAEMVLEALVPGHVRLVITSDLAAWAAIAGRADAVELA